jgi:hypothetical protein
MSLPHSFPLKCNDYLPDTDSFTVDIDPQNFGANPFWFDTDEFTLPAPVVYALLRMPACDPQTLIGRTFVVNEGAALPARETPTL